MQVKVARRRYPATISACSRLAKAWLCSQLVSRGMAFSVSGSKVPLGSDRIIQYGPSEEISPSALTRPAGSRVAAARACTPPLE
jgi:hypothetical protein